MSDHELYRQYYEVIIARQLSNNEGFDKAILSLSSAGLALSLTFFRFVVPIDKAVSIHTLEISWYLFLAALISTILSFLTSQKALALELMFAEKYYLENDQNYEKKNNPASILTELLHRFSAFFFIGATISIVVFVTKNV
ncbi:MAG: hypothetical protein KDI20_14290 [Pseudomonadales bacterium]|nr:hypothetical protein [Pseudomonadales bacterium]